MLCDKTKFIFFLVLCKLIFYRFILIVLKLYEGKKIKENTSSFRFRDRQTSEGKSSVFLEESKRQPCFLLSYREFPVLRRYFGINKIRTAFVWSALLPADYLSFWRYQT